MSNGLTSTQAADRLGVDNRLVRLWCQQGRFPGAQRVEHPRGDYWVIPEKDLNSFQPPKMGRPPNAQTNGTAKAPAETTAKLNKAFREATEAEEASKKVAKKRGKK